MKKLALSLILLAAFAAGLLFFYSINKQTPLQFDNVLVYEKPRLIMPFELANNKGESFTNQHLANQWSLVFMGYTSCPDICPATLQQLNFIYPELKTIASNTQVILLTADPKRDSVERLDQYINYFNAEFIAARGEHDQLFPFARNLGLMYAIADDSSQENYLVDHSAAIILINPAGQIAAIFKPVVEPGQIAGVNMEQLAVAFKALVARFNN